MEDGRPIKNVIKFNMKRNYKPRKMSRGWCVDIIAEPIFPECGNQSENGSEKQEYP